MDSMRCIRIFKTLDAAKQASETLKEANIKSLIKEDRFGKLTLEDLGMTPRFRLYIDRNDITKAAEFLAKKTQ